MSVVSCAALGTLSGDAISNVGISGSFTMPLMKRMGFTPVFAAAVVTTASVGGVIMPPMMGAIIFIMVEVANIPYVEIIKAALVPSLLYFFAIFMQIEFYSKRRNLMGLPRAELPGKGESIWEAKFLFLIFALLIYFLAVATLFPVRAAYYTLFCMVILFLFDSYTKVSVEKIIEGFERAGRFVIVVTPLIAAAGIVFASISLTGTGGRIAGRLVAFCGDSLLLLTIITGLLCYVLCLGISAMLAYILLATLVVPGMIQFGVPPIAAHFFVIYMGLSGFYTPPYAVVALTASSMSGAPFYSTCWQSMKMAIVAYLVPITFILDPVLLLEIDSWAHFAYRLGLSLVAIYLLSAALEGYLHKRPMLWFERLILGIGSTLLFIPYQAFLIYGSGVTIIALILFFLNPATRRPYKESAV